MLTLRPITSSARPAEQPLGRLAEDCGSGPPRRSRPSRRARCRGSSADAPRARARSRLTASARSPRALEPLAADGDRGADQRRRARRADRARRRRAGPAIASEAKPGDGAEQVANRPGHSPPSAAASTTAGHEEDEGRALAEQRVERASRHATPAATASRASAQAASGRGRPAAASR